MISLYEPNIDTNNIGRVSETHGWRVLGTFQLLFLESWKFVAGSTSFITVCEMFTVKCKFC